MRRLIKKLASISLAFLLASISLLQMNTIDIQADAVDIFIDEENNIFWITNEYLPGGWSAIGSYILSQGKPAYCIEPEYPAKFGEDVYATSTLSKYNGYSEEVKAKIAAIAHFGYQYKGRTHSKYYLATQNLIWKLVDENAKSQSLYVTSSPAVGNEPPNDLKNITKEIAALEKEIEKDVDAYLASVGMMDFVIQDENGKEVGVSGENASYDLAKVGKTYTITDRNGVLQYRKLPEHTFKGNVTKKDNTLTITPSKDDIGLKKITFSSDLAIEDLGYNPIILVSDDYQKLIVRGNVSGAKGGSISLNTIAFGGLVVQKRDYETKKDIALGGATLQDAQYQITNISKEKILFKENDIYKEIQPNQIVTTIHTDEKGIAKLNDDSLMQGKYRIEEVAAPNGYLKSGMNLSKEFTIQKDGEIIDLSSVENAPQNQIIRGDFSFRKIASGNQNALANVKFKITSKTTGESHIVQTDENGYYSSSNDYNQHSYKTNTGEVDSGLWFGEDTKVNDALGALPYDTYILEEIASKENAGYEMHRSEFKIIRNNLVINLNNIENLETKKNPNLKTKVNTDNANNLIEPLEKITIVDTVYYEDFPINKEVTIKGQLFDKTTDAFLPIQQEITFTPISETGSVDVIFEFDARKLGGHTLVVFESAYLDDEEFVSHADKNDMDQTIYIKEKEITIQTSAYDAKDGDKIIDQEKNINVIDEVRYTNLDTTQEYEMVGVLIDKETQKEVIENGEPIRATTTFTPTTSDGSVDVSFLFDARQFESKEVVIFEELYQKDGNEKKKVAEHKDIHAASQTIQVNKKPKIPNTSDEKNLMTYWGLFGLSFIVFGIAYRFKDMHI